MCFIYAYQIFCDYFRNAQMTSQDIQKLKLLRDYCRYLCAVCAKREKTSICFICTCHFIVTTSDMRKWHQRIYGNSHYSETTADIYAQFALKVRGLESASHTHTRLFVTTSGMRKWHHRIYINSSYCKTTADIYAQFALKVRGLEFVPYTQLKYFVTTSGMREWHHRIY